ncbi:MAG: glycosyltransferase family 4 protein [Promethearchaeota archaeon]
MKITFITTHLTEITGAKNVVLDYANAFNERGHDVTIVAQRIDHNNFQFNKSISLIEIRDKLPSNPFYWIRFKIIKKKYLEILNKQDSDIYFSHLFPSNYFCSQLKKNSNFKHVYYCYEPFRYFYDKKFYSNAPILLKILSFLLRLIYKKFDIEGARNADIIICISNFTKKKIKKCYNQNSYLHYPVINLEKEVNKLNHFNLKQKLLLKENIPIIFTLGLSHHMKGAKELIYIFYKILTEIPNTILLIGGHITKQNIAIIKKSINKLKIPKKNVIFYGRIERKHLANIYNSAILTLYTAIDEPFGLIPIESMKYGTPVIAFEGGPSETILHNKTGYLIKNGDLNKFANKAIKIIRDEALRRKFSKNAIFHVKKNFNFENSVLNLEMIFRSLGTFD